MFKYLAVLLCVAAAAYGHTIRVTNNCKETLWIGTLNNPDKMLPANGGFQLDSYRFRDLDVPMNWGGRVWARTNCDASGRCETGDCGNRIECAGNGGTPPVSLAEITFDGWGDLDYYDVSLVDGYNVPVYMEPLPGTFRPEEGKYKCTRAGCFSDLNAICPEELKVNNANGVTVACLSACMKFNTDEYCCRNAHGTPDKCKSSDWPFNYPAIFKQACPEAYSYAYDDTTSTFTCASHSPNSSGYEVRFCP